MINKREAEREEWGSPRISYRVNLIDPAKEFFSETFDAEYKAENHIKQMISDYANEGEYLKRDDFKITEE